VSEEAGSRLICITSNPAARVRVDVLKGKNQIPETIEVVLAEFIDLKGVKANGNRLSQHEVKNIEVLDVEEPTAEQEEVKVEPVEEADMIIEDQPEQTQEEDLQADPEPDAMATPESESNKDPQPETPKSKVKLEITNPDDIDIDDTGQLGLF
jgi:topoisomerase-4 subunit A